MWHIARKEFRETRRDGRFRAAVAAILLLLTASLLFGLRQHRAQEAHRAEATAADRYEWLNQGKRNAHAAAHFGRYAFQPRSALALADSGVSAYLGVAVWMEAHHQNPFRFRAVEDTAGVDRFGALSAAAVLQMLLPLVIIFLTFGAFAGEREAGTLRQVLALGVSPHTLALGKTMGIALALALLLVPAAVLGVAALAFNGKDAFLNDGARFALSVGAYLLYFGAWTAVSLAVSIIAHSTRTALLSLLLFWFVGTLLAPRVAADIAEQRHPTPAYTTFWAGIHRDMEAGASGHNPADKRTDALLAATLKKYGVTRKEDLPVNFAGVALQTGEEHGNTVFDRHYGALWGTYRAHERVHLFAAFLSPLPAMRFLGMGLAGTDLAHHGRFARASEDYRRDLQRKLNGAVAAHADPMWEGDAAFWASVSEFSYAPPGAGWAVRQQAGAAALLFLWFAASLGLLFVSAARMRGAV